jgi:hypothetical protein
MSWTKYSKVKKNKVKQPEMSREEIRRRLDLALERLERELNEPVLFNNAPVIRNVAKK